MALLNYTTTVKADKTAGEIIQKLAGAGASAILLNYDDEHGILIGLSFKIRSPHGELPFILPVNDKAVEEVLRRQYHQGRVPRSVLADGQARRVAWRILKDWVEAQLALIETEMVTLEQVFFPYLQTGPNGETLYERALGSGFKGMLEAPKEVS